MPVATPATPTHSCDKKYLWTLSMSKHLYICHGCSLKKWGVYNMADCVFQRCSPMCTHVSHPTCSSYSVTWCDSIERCMVRGGRSMLLSLELGWIFATVSSNKGGRCDIVLLRLDYTHSFPLARSLSMTALGIYTPPCEDPPGYMERLYVGIAADNPSWASTTVSTNLQTFK